MIIFLQIWGKKSCKFEGSSVMAEVSGPGLDSQCQWPLSSFSLKLINQNLGYIYNNIIIITTVLQDFSIEVVIYKYIYIIPIYFAVAATKGYCGSGFFWLCIINHTCAWFYRNVRGRQNIIVTIILLTIEYWKSVIDIFLILKTRIVETVIWRLFSHPDNWDTN